MKVNKESSILDKILINTKLVKRALKSREISWQPHVYYPLITLNTQD